MFTLINLSKYDLMVLVKNGEIIAVGTEVQCEAYAEQMNFGTYQINYLDEKYEPSNFTCWKCGTDDIDEYQRFCPHCGACGS